MIARLVFTPGVCRGRNLDPDPAPLDAGIVDGDEDNPLAAGGQVRHVDPQGFQTIFELFQGEVILV